ncbi:CHAP domain-containing protein [uncultured Granulicatella sp.]|uniref:CHAP domain-containing protein n=1 Tax=uncultured Granulicatella sp. TaxID=316089 RepID=UPI00261DF815|nr:CHAP domain-containing protein [uncultured Granulicatella sp.]
MKKRLLTVLVTGTVLTLGALAPKVSAQDFDSQINSVNSTIANINDKKAAVNATIDSLVSELSGVQTKIDATKAQKAEAQAAIDSLKSEISKLEKVIAERNERLEEQARAVQTNGARSYVDFLLNAENLSDIVNRIGVVMDLIGANRDLMQQQAEDKKQVEAKEEQQQAKLAEQQKAEEELQGLQTKLNETFDKNKVLLANLSQEELAEISKRDGLVAEKEAFQKRLAEEKAKAEAEAARIAEASRQALAAEVTNSVATTTSYQSPTSRATSSATAATTQTSSYTYTTGGGFPAVDPSYRAALNGGYFGQCTYYVFNRMAQVGTPIGHSMMGNAAEWPAYARSYGYSVSNSPSAGSAIVFQQGLAGADPTYGHVAFVEAVNADGSLYISEMNVQGLNVISYRTISASVAARATYIRF